MSATAILIVGVGAVLALPLAARLSRRRFDPFEPIVIFALAWCVMFVVRPAAILIRHDTDFYGVDIGPTLDRAELLGLAGAVAFVVGHELSLGRRAAARLPTPPEDVAPGTALRAAFVATGLGLVAFALFVASSGGFHTLDVFFHGRSLEFNLLIEKSTTYLWYGSLLVVPAALVGFAVALMDRRPVTVFSAALLSTLALLRTVPIGNRIFILLLVGTAVVFIFLRARRRPGVAVVSVGLAVALVGSDLALTFRDPETRSGPAAMLRGLVITPSRVVSPLTKGADAEMAPALAGALLAVPSELPRRYGMATFGDFFIRPIPRRLWAGKPVSPGHEVTDKVWPVAVATGDFDPAFTPLLYLYWDFGIPGVFVGMAMLGIGARALYEYLVRHERSPLAQLLFAAGIWYLVIAVRYDPVSVIVWGIILFVPIVIALVWGAPPRSDENQVLHVAETPPAKTFSRSRGSDP